MITINGKTNSDYNANFIHWSCTPPEPKMEIATVPLRDGAINLTSMLSDRIIFGTRTITIGLELRGLRSTWPAVYSQLLLDLHGQPVTVERSEEAGWEWEGWATVGALEDHGASAGVTITVTAQPYKKTIETVDEDFVISVHGSPISLVWTLDSYPIVIPEFETTAAGMSVTYEGITWPLPLGESKPYGIKFYEGHNGFVVNGNGTITIRVKGGSL